MAEGTGDIPSDFAYILTKSKMQSRGKEAFGRRGVLIVTDDILRLLRNPAVKKKQRERIEQKQ